MQTSSSPRRRGLARNTAFALGLLMRQERAYPLYASLLVALQLVQPLLGSLIPAVAVALLTRGASYGLYALALTLSVLGYALCAAGIRTLDTRMNLCFGRSNLMEFNRLFFRKSITMDYCNFERSDVQALQTVAQRSINNGQAGVRGLGSRAHVWLYSLLGLLLYGGVAVSLDLRILLVLAGMAASSMALSALRRRYLRAHDKTWRGWWNKFEYLAYTATNSLQAAKDARLQSIEGWFGESMRQVAKLIFGQEARSQVLLFLGNLSDDVFLLLRDLIAYAVLLHACCAGEIDAAGFTLMLGMIASFSSWLTGFVEADNILREASRQAESYRDFLDYPDVVRHGEGADTAPLSRPLSLELRDVSFTHPGSDTPALSHVNLTVRPGEHIALVGVNGAGKTTLVKLLCKLYPVAEGEILVSGVSLQAFSFEDWRRVVAPLFQQVEAQPFTIAENIAASEAYDEMRVWDCLRRAGLDDFVRALPLGLQTPLVDHYLDPSSIVLSGGQMQRLLFARTLYHGGDLLLLDEPTAALDPLAEANLYMQYSEAARGKTCFFISHRLASTRFCDRILFMEHGQIVEQGTHEELMALGGRYAEMFAVQSQYYQENGKGGSADDIACQS